MNIIEAISDTSNEIIKLSNNYIGRIYIDGKLNYRKPVDIRLGEINIPLRLSDIEFIYDKTSKNSRVYNTDAVLDTYFPIGSEFSLTDGARLKLISYGPIKTYNNQIYVDMYCTLQNEGVYIVENINSNQIKEKIKNELNIMIESNEIIKNLLPQYSSNWIKFNDDDIDAIKKFNATKILHLIDKLEYDERYYYMNDINSILSQSYTSLPTSITTKMKEISSISIKEYINAGFAGVHSLYNPRYVFEWLIYVFGNKLIEDETLHDEFYLVNKLGQKCNIKVSKTDNNYEIYFSMPDECAFNYKLLINNCISIGTYICYNIESMQLFKIDKLNEANIAEYDNIKSQYDNLKCVTEIIAILSASTYTGITCKEYYDNIDTYINNISTVKVNTVEDSTEEGGDNNEQTS